MDDNVIPIVEQLQRRLAPDNPISQGQGEEEEHPGVRNDIDTGEQTGNSNSVIFSIVSLIIYGVKKANFHFILAILYSL